MSSNSTLFKPEKHTRIITVVLIYALLASSWILLSDKLLEIFFSDPSQIIAVGLIKGLLFVGITSLLLYGLLWRWAGSNARTKSSPVNFKRLKGAFIVLVVTILLFAGAGMLHTYYDKRSIALDRLKTVASEKSVQVADWLNKQRRSAEFIQTNDYLADLYQRWHVARDEPSGEKLRKRLEVIRRNQELYAVILLDADGGKVWESTPSVLSSSVLEAARISSADRKIRMVGPYRDESGTSYLNFIVPLLAVDLASPLIILRNDLQKELFPMINSWPMSGVSGEMLLFKRDNGRLLYLSGRRALGEAPANFHFSRAMEQRVYKQLSGGESLLKRPIEGLDEHGTPIIGLAGKVAGSDWYIMVKQNREELFEHVYRDIEWIGLVGLLASIMAGAGYYLIRKDQQLIWADFVQRSQIEQIQALQLLKVVVESSDDAIFAKDMEGRYLLINQAASRFVGKPVEEIIGTDDSYLFPSEQAEMLRAFFFKVINENKTVTQEEMLNTTLGERCFLATKGPLRDTDGKVIGIFGVSRDITDRKQAELELQESEARFRALVEQSLAGIYIIQDDYFPYVNPQFATMFGFSSPQALIDRVPVADLVCPEDREKVAENIRARIDGEVNDAHYTFTGLRYDGSRVELEVHGCVFPYRGRPAVIGLILDITARKTAEANLRFEHERNRRYLDTLQTLMVALDCAGNITMVNHAALEMLGYAENDLLGRDWFSVCLPEPEGKKIAYPIFRRIVAGDIKSAEYYENRIVCRNGRRYLIAWRNALLFDNAGRISGVLSAGQDITERRAAEERLHRQTEELSLRNAELERINRLVVGRELEMIALKKQVNALSVQLGLNPPFPLSFLDGAAPEDSP